MKRDEFDNSTENHEKKGSSKKVKIALIGIISVLAIIFIVLGVSYFNRQKLIKQADTLVSIEKYEDGISIYDSLLSKKYSTSVMDKRDLAVRLMESEENLSKGIEAYEDDDINKAVKFLSKVPKDDEKRYKLASEELDNIEETIIIDLEQLIEDGDLDEARQIVASYLKLSPKSTKVKNLNDTIAAREKDDKKAEENEEKARENEEKTLKDKEVAANTAAKNAEARERKSNETRNTANSITGTYKSIVSDKANLRDAPTLKSGVVTVLRRGDGVYIHETQIESADRIWCHVSTEKNGYVEYGWISYNTMNYNIQ